MEQIISTTAKVKENNKELIKKALIRLGQATKNQVAVETGLSVATCNTLLNELSRTEEIQELQLERKGSGAGRPSKTYQLNNHLRLICCISCLQDNNSQILRYAISDSIGTIIAEDALYVPVIDYTVIHDCIAKLLTEYSRIQLFSFGIPGNIDKTQKISHCMIDSLEGLSLTERIMKDFSLPSIVENDMNLIAYGLDKQKTGSDSRIVVALSFLQDKCNSSGIVIHHKIIHGKNNFAGDISGFILQPENTHRLLHPVSKLTSEELIAKAMSLFISILNPDIVMLTGKGISISQISPIADACKSLIPENHMPELSFAPDTKSYYTTGLIEHAFSYMEV